MQPAAEPSSMHGVSLLLAVAACIVALVVTYIVATRLSLRLRQQHQGRSPSSPPLQHVVPTPAITSSKREPPVPSVHGTQAAQARQRGGKQAPGVSSPSTPRPKQPQTPQPPQRSLQEDGALGSGRRGGPQGGHVDSSDGTTPLGVNRPKAPEQPAVGTSSSSGVPLSSPAAAQHNDLLLPPSSKLAASAPAQPSPPKEVRTIAAAAAAAPTDEPRALLAVEAATAAGPSQAYKEAAAETLPASALPIPSAGSSTSTSKRVPHVAASSSMAVAPASAPGALHARQPDLLSPPASPSTLPQLPDFAPLRLPTVSSMHLTTSFSLAEPTDHASTRSSPSQSSSLPDKARQLLATISLGSTATSSRSLAPSKVQRSMHKAANKAAAAANAVLDSAKAALAKIGSKISLDEATGGPAPRAMVSSKDGDKRAVFRTNKVSPAPVFYAMIHPKGVTPPPSTAVHPKSGMAPSVSKAPPPASAKAGSLGMKEAASMPPPLPPVHVRAGSAPGDFACQAQALDSQSQAQLVVGSATHGGATEVPVPDSPTSSASLASAGEKRRSRACSLTPLQLGSDEELGCITPLASSSGPLPALVPVSRSSNELQTSSVAGASRAGTDTANVDDRVGARLGGLSTSRPPSTSTSDEEPRLPSNLDLYMLSSTPEPSEHGGRTANAAPSCSSAAMPDDSGAQAQAWQGYFAPTSPPAAVSGLWSPDLHPGSTKGPQSPWRYAHPAGTPLSPSGAGPSIWSDASQQSLGLPPLTSTAALASPSSSAPWPHAEGSHVTSAAAPLGPCARATTASDGSANSIAAALSCLSGFASMAGSSFGPTTSDASSGSGAGAAAGPSSLALASSMEVALKGSGGWEAIAAMLAQEGTSLAGDGDEEEGPLDMQQGQPSGLDAGNSGLAAGAATGWALMGQDEQLEVLRQLLAAGVSEQQQQQQQQQQQDEDKQQQQQLALLALLQQWQESIAGQLLERAGLRPDAFLPSAQQQPPSQPAAQSSLPLLSEQNMVALLAMQRQAGTGQVWPTTALSGLDQAAWAETQGAAALAGAADGNFFTSEALAQAAAMAGLHKRAAGGRGREAGVAGNTHSPRPSKKQAAAHRGGGPPSPLGPWSGRSQQQQQQVAGSSGAGAGAAGSGGDWEATTPTSPAAPVHPKSKGGKGRSSGMMASRLGAAPVMLPVYGVGPSPGMQGPGAALLSPGAGPLLGAGGVPVVAALPQAPVMMVPALGGQYMPYAVHGPGRAPAGQYVRYAQVQDALGNVVLVPVQAQVPQLRRLPEVTPLTAAVVQVKHAGAVPGALTPMASASPVGAAKGGKGGRNV